MTRKLSLVLLVLIALLAASSPLAAAEEAYIIAVLPFENLSGEPDHNWLGPGIMESMIADLMNVREWVVVDRKNLEKRLGEIELSHSDLVASESQLAIGEELAANALITGSYQVLAEQILISAQVLGVETGRVIRASKLQGDYPDDFFVLQGRIVINLVNDINSYNAQEDRPTTELAADLIEAIEEQPAESFLAFELYNRAAESFHGSDYGRAEIYITDALELDPEYVDGLFLAGQIKAAQHHHEEALKFYDGARSAADSRGENATAAIIPAFIGDVYMALGRFDEALASYRQNLEERERLHGRWHPDTAWGYRDLGNFYLAPREFEKALPLFEESLAINSSVFPGDHTEVAYSYQSLGTVYRELGDLEMAQRYFQRTIDALEARFGSNDIRLTQPNIDLGWTLAAMDRVGEALALFEKALETRERVLGYYHPDTATAYTDVAEIQHHALGNPRASLESHLKALEIRERVLGPEHFDTTWSYHSVGGVYHYGLRVYQTALDYYGKALEVRERTLGRYHGDTAAVYNDIGGAHHDAGRFHEALEADRTSLEIRRRVFGSNDPQTALSWMNVGSDLSRLEEYKEALAAFENALNIYEKAFGPDSPDARAAYGMMADTYSAMGRNRKAREYRQKSRE